MDWTEGALCAGLPTSWWFPERGNSKDLMATRALAYATCTLCCHQKECNETYEELAPDSQTGIWAGLNAKQRKRIKNTEESANPTTRETILARHQQNFLSIKTQCHIQSKALEDVQVKKTNEWLLEELTLKEFG